MLRRTAKTALLIGASLILLIQGGGLIAGDGLDVWAAITSVLAPFLVLLALEKVGPRPSDLRPAGTDVSIQALRSAEATLSEIAGGGEKAASVAGRRGEILDDLSISAKALRDALDWAQTAADEGRNLLNDASSGVDDMGDAAETVLAQLEESTEVTRALDAAVSRLAEDTGSVSTLAERIREIARKTEMLAINAGIEASRAGYEGRGFAVIAREVGGLSQMTGDAVRSINAAVDGLGSGLEAIQGRLADTSERMATSLERSRSGIEAAETARCDIDSALCSVDAFGEVVIRQNAIFEPIEQLIDDLRQDDNALLEDSVRQGALIERSRHRIAEQLRNASFDAESGQSESSETPGTDRELDTDHGPETGDGSDQGPASHEPASHETDNAARTAA